MGSRREEVDASVSGGQEVVVHPFPPFGRSMCAETGGLAVADASEREREKERERERHTHTNTRDTPAFGTTTSGGTRPTDAIEE